MSGSEDKGIFLTPARRRELEALLLRADEQATTAPPLLRLRVYRARDLVALMLQAEGPEGTEEEHRQLMEALRIEMAGEPWPYGPQPVPATVRRHARAEKLARKVALGWIGHPAVSREVAAATPALMTLVEPLGMPDQQTVTRVTARFLDAAAFWPDGTEWPNPFDGAEPALLEEARRIRPLFVSALTELAQRIEAAGARLDSTDSGVLLVLAQLTLLDVDLNRPAVDIVDDLNVLPPGWIDRDAATIGHVATHASRHGRTARFQADLAAGAEFLAHRLGPPAIRTPYAGGGRRKSALSIGRDRRRGALRVVLQTYPDVTPGQLRATWSASLATAGGVLRNRMGLQPHDPAPSESTLRADLSQLRR
ncbi:MAG: hypothetical protein ACHQ01_07635 [Candidatus Limnocylindrales bacterium]